MIGLLRLASIQAGIMQLDFPRDTGGERSQDIQEQFSVREDIISSFPTLEWLIVHMVDGIVQVRVTVLL